MTPELHTPAVSGRGLRLAYWIVTVLLCLNLFAGVLDLLKTDLVRQNTLSIGMPLGMLPFYGIIKIIGGIVLLAVANPVLKIGAYAGVIFYFLGAAAAHVTSGQPFAAVAPALVILTLAVASFLLWYRKVGLRVTTEG
ncbi:DoxX family protein [Hymenobacter terrenus]|uniref:DoxX family protein n=1 Tax=Hymenobacter terrenus TaxID=1629124 RepID=UPI0006976B27|nr:DoxX family protein [Hymenobacter terrenus]